MSRGVEKDGEGGAVRGGAMGGLLGERALVLGAQWALTDGHVQATAGRLVARTSAGWAAVSAAVRPEWAVVQRGVCTPAI